MNHTSQPVWVLVMKWLVCLLLPLTSYGQAVKGRSMVGEAYAREQVRQAVRGPVDVATAILPNKQVAIAVAESILFPAYGQRNIVNERPYEVYRINGCWYISGTLPAGYDGGTFEIVLKAADGQVLRLTHGK